MSNRRTIGVILAGGTGSRVGLSIPKQLIKIAGKPVMEHTIQILEDSDAVDEIFVLMHPDHIDRAREISARFPKVTKVLAGGQTRNETTRIALEALEERDPATKVVFHDAVRPLLEQRIIEELVVALDDHDAVDVAIPSADTIIKVNEANEIIDIPARGQLRRGQTPQAFRLSTIRKAYDLAWQDPSFTATDDCSVVLRYLPKVPIKVVTGSDQNMKITEPIDVFIADKLFQIGTTVAPETMAPYEYRRHLAGKVMVVLGGSYGIGASIAEMASSFGATVHCFSRSGTNTHVEDTASVEQALRDARAASGRIDYIVVTAGVLHRGQLVDMSWDDIQEGINVNYVAPVIAARAGMRYLEESHGQLLLFTSSSYTRGRADYSIYSSAKAAVVNLTQALADEWSGAGIRVNCINPERTATPMRTKAFGSEDPGSLLAAEAVALTSIDVLISPMTGHVVDVRRQNPDRPGARGKAHAARIAEILQYVASGDGGETEDEPTHA